MRVFASSSSRRPDLGEGERERLGLDGVWRATHHLEDLPDGRGQGTGHLGELELNESRRRPQMNQNDSFSPRSLQLSVCKELQLPDRECKYTADLVVVSAAAGPLEMVSVQAISVLAVSDEGLARLWPSLAQEGNYTDTEVDLGHLCNFVVAVQVCHEDLILPLLGCHKALFLIFRTFFSCLC